MYWAREDITVISAGNDNLILFLSISFIPACPCCGLLHHIHLNYDISLYKVRCSSLKSNKMYYLLSSEVVGILEGPKLFSSAPCSVCSEYHHRQGGKRLIGNAPPRFGWTVEEGNGRNVQNRLLLQDRKTQKGQILPE